MEKSINEILEDPYIYAAIYGRKSHTLDNNSREVQIEKCKERLCEENLILYKCYFEEVSATKKFTYKRKEYSKLLQAAKDGCFKTLIIYSLDRLIRNSDDWIETKRVLDKYNIGLIICDRPRDFDMDSVEGQIIISMLVSNAVNEPKRIKERTSNGRRIQRENGIYTCGDKVPLGYERKRIKAPLGDKVITQFEQIPIEIAIVKYMFDFSKSYIYKNNSFSSKILYESLISIFDLIINNFNIKYLEKFIEEAPENYTRELIKTIVSQIEQSYNVEFIKKKLKSNLEFLKNKSNKNSSAYILNLLKNSVYAGLMLLEVNSTKEEDTIIEINGTSQNGYIINKDKFVEITNLKGCITFDTFQYIYCYLVNEKLKRKDNTPNFLFKNKLKCSCGKKLYLRTTGFLQCDNLKCKPYYKNDILKLSLSPIIDNIFSDSEYGFLLFEKQIYMKLNKLNNRLISLKHQKTQHTIEYLSSNNKEYTDSIIEISASIVELTNTIEIHREKLNHILNLKEFVLGNKLNNKNNNDIYNSIKGNVLDYILSNEILFIDVFNEIVKEVQVILNAKSNTIHTSISYEFQSVNSSSLHKSIN